MIDTRTPEEGHDDRVTISRRMPFLSLNIGHVFTVVSVLISGAGAYYGMTFRLDSLDYRIGRMEQSLMTLTALSISDARATEKISNVERRVDRLELEITALRRPPN